MEGRLKDNMKVLFKDYAFRHFPVLRIVGINNFALHWKINKLEPWDTRADKSVNFLIKLLPQTQNKLKLSRQKQNEDGPRKQP